MTDSPEPDTSTRRTEVSCFSKAAIQNPRCRINFVIYIYIYVRVIDTTEKTVFTCCR